MNKVTFIYETITEQNPFSIYYLSYDLRSVMLNVIVYHCHKTRFDCTCVCAS